MQIKKLVAFFSFFVAILFCRCKNQASQHTVVMLDSIVVDSVPFKKLFQSAMVDSTTILHVEGIDSLATYKLYLVQVEEAVLLGAPNPVKNSILYVSGLRKSDKKRVVLLDTDNDGNIAEEAAYCIDENLPYISINNVEYKEGGTIKTATFYVKPHINKEMVVSGGRKKKYRHAIDNLGAMVRPAYHYGVFRIGEANFKFALFNYYRNDYNSETAFLCMVPANGSFPPPEASPVYYQQGDVFYLGQKGYRFKSMSKDGSQISIEQLPVNQKNIGADSGLYAIPVQGVDVRSGKNYDLSNAKNYTILDFWGTWCGPCLKMLPDLQAFNEHQERYNFQLVSIAYDQDAKKVRDHILSQGVYWTNLFDDSNNSVITDQYKVSVFPTFILIDKKGKILYRGVGQDGLSKIESILKKDL